MSKITEYQRRMWSCLSYMALCRFYIIRDPGTGNFVIKKAGKVRLFLYYALWINTLTKIVYLILAYRMLVPVEVHFLDQMGIWDWFLCFSQIVQEVNLWYRQYPLFEVLCANWKMQEDVFQKLGSPDHIEKLILKNDRSLVRMHSIIVSAGCCALGIQFYMAPKYAANTYGFFLFDHWILRIFFCIHEVVFVYHIWVYQACSIILCEMFASSYTHIMRELTKTFKQLIDLGVRQCPITETEETGVLHQQQRQLRRNNSAASKSFKNKFISKRRLDPKTIVPGTSYDIMTLLKDYEKMTLATNAFNSWAGLLMGGIMGSNYSQFVSDVFMMIQLLKEPETDMLAVFFYADDACAGMLILFRMLIIISRLFPASEEFLHVFKQYLTYDTPLRPYLLKYQRRVRIIATKLGGYRTKSITVPKGINALMQWYIAAAMWQRPVDRLT
ncbi:unnamed protein product [Orchesella dallaii]|uniref:Odorant receptor n=1 Tax=Orchesella dallaii TaxID=48710 RepID=A0ABP1Q6M3_9HEXA